MVPNYMHLRCNMRVEVHRVNLKIKLLICSAFLETEK